MTNQAKIFITDLDGTALGGNSKPYARFSDSFSEFLDSLAKQGCRWGINTTWDVGGQWDLVNISSVKSRPEFMMAEYGRRLARSSSIGPQFIQPYTDEMDARVKEICARKIAPLIRTICSAYASERIFYYGHLFNFILDSKENLDEFKGFLAQFFNDSELVCTMKERSLAVRPAFLNKGIPLQEISKRYYLVPEQIIVAGDEPADLAMMNPELASFFICPSNAAEEVKEHVLKHGGAVGQLPYSAGVIQAYDELSNRHNWHSRL